jgi:acyl-CoA synthetase (AMP-forming)/AMP-acid ligase II/pyrroloquinoline quinone (PQQ) biosynthesis protein C
MSAVLAAVARHASAAPDRVALRGPQEALSYAALAVAIEDARRWLARARPRVLGIAAANSPDWAVLDLAAFAEGIPAVPLPAFFSPTQQRHALRDAGVDLLVTDVPAHYADLDVPCARGIGGTGLVAVRVASMPARLPARTAKVTYTSGTTGAPKGVCLDAGAMEAVARSLAEACILAPDDRHLAGLPLATLLENVGGLYAPLLGGGCATLAPLADLGVQGAAGFDAHAFLAALARHRATTTILVPQMLAGLVAALERGTPAPGRLRFVAVGGGKVSPDLLDRAAALGLPVFEGYGLSECASVVALNTPAARKRGAVGQPLPHATVTIADDGEVFVAGAMLLGYAGEPIPARYSWPTGDLGRLDDEGYLHLSGRKRDMLVTAFGRNVAPDWVEAELARHGAIAQVAVFGEARPWLAAVIVPQRGGDRGGVAAALACANDALPDYARVRAWVEADGPFTAANELATANGRLRRDAIRARYGARLDRLYDDDEAMMTFYEELTAATAGDRAGLLAIPFIRDGAAGRLRLRDYVAFLAQAYHHVKHTLPLLMACGAKLPERLEWLRQAMVEYVTEELGHQEWILDDLRACGADAEQIRNGRPDLAAEVMVAYAYDTIERRNPVGFLGMVLVLEGTSVLVATQAAEALGRSLGLPQSAFRYLTSHGALDQGHVRFYETLVNRLDDPGDRAAVIRCARVFYKLYGDVFRALDGARRPAKEIA